MRLGWGFGGNKLRKLDYILQAMAIPSLGSIRKTSRLTAAINMTAETLGQSALRRIHENGELFTANEQAEMRVITWGLLATPTQDPHRPGTFGDYVGLFDFHFDIKVSTLNLARFAWATSYR
jgi:hypothetical protein